MKYDSENEYFIYKLENLKEGTYKYTFQIKMKDGTTKEVLDPYNSRDGQSTITYNKPDISSSITIYPEKITAGNKCIY